MDINKQNEPPINTMVDYENENVERIITAIKIDVLERTITEVESSGYNNICEILECNGIDHFTVNQFNDSLYVDEVGWLHRETIGGFKINGNYFAGHGLIVGTNSQGKDVDPWFTVDMLQKLITFIEVAEIDQIKTEHFLYHV